MEGCEDDVLEFRDVPVAVGEGDVDVEAAGFVGLDLAPVLE